MRELGVPEDECDSYIGGLYRLLSQGASEADLIDYLNQVETNAMGGSLRDRTLLRPVAQKLLKIDVRLKEP